MSENKKNGIILGLTGPSGSGKSAVSAIMDGWEGVEVVNADHVAHEVMNTRPCIEELTAAYGEAILYKDGTIDRRVLGGIVFSDPEKLRLLGEISYPYIIAECKARLEAALQRGARAAILDAPTLFESGSDALCDAVISVVSPREVRLQRILQRDGITEEAAEARFRNQFENEFYTSRSQFVIHNTADWAHLHAECDRCRDYFDLYATERSHTIMSEKTKGEQLREELLMNPKNLTESLSAEELKAAYDFCEGYKVYLDESKTEREAVAYSISLLEKAGYVPFDHTKQYKAGDKVYLNNRGKALIASTIGSLPITEGVRIGVAHVDSPRLDLKPRPLFEEAEQAFFKTHYYGGIKKYQWTAIPLALHGVVVRRDGSILNVCVGEEEGDPVFCVTDLLPHLAADQAKKPLGSGIEGEKLNILIGSACLQDDAGSEKVKIAIAKILFEKYGIHEDDFLSAELCAVPAFKARDIGFDRSLIGSYGHDDRVCAYPILMAEMEEKAPAHTTVTILADKEEVGSDGPTGMNSYFLKDFIEDLAEMQGAAVRHVLPNSRCFSADVNAAFDPAYGEVHDRRNAAYINYGVVVTKYTGARGKSGTNDATAEMMGFARQLLDADGVVWQIGELGKVDQGGGGTVALYVSQHNVDTVDLGVPVLSMHAPFEVVAKTDVYMTYRAMRAFYR